eukprot:scaffold827_cov369-Prasinococcus_capsulatus_cf.AAC.15
MKGHCGGAARDASGLPCTWQIRREVRTVNATCANAAVERMVQAANATCFDACPQPYNTTSECWIECFFDTALQMTKEELMAPFTTAITSDDVAHGGCPTRPPYVPPAANAEDAIPDDDSAPRPLAPAESKDGGDAPAASTGPMLSS